MSPLAKRPMPSARLWSDFAVIHQRPVVAMPAIDLRALSLRERVQLLKRHNAGSTRSSPFRDPAVEDPRRLVWRPREEMLRIGVWEDRLRVLDATEDLYLSTLAGGHLAGSEAMTVNVHAFIAEATQEVDAVTMSAIQAPYAQHLPPLPSAIAAAVARRFHNAIRNTSLLQWRDWDACVVQQGLLHDYLCHLQDTTAPALVTELHVSRRENRLSGDTPEQRFVDFGYRLIHEPQWLREFFDKYPVLARHLAVRVQQWVARTVEMLQRAREDHDVILTLAHVSSGTLPSGPEHRSRVVRVSSPLGDIHRGGQAVHLVEFADGGLVIYKPRSLGMDRAFQDFISWLNARGAQPQLEAVEMIDRVTHGWCRYVTSAPCADRDAVGRFYARQGAHLAILYLLGGYDFFWENVKASGEFPYLIDLECVASPLLPRLNGVLFDSASRRYFNESVARAGLLPSWSWSNGVEAGVNVGALTDIVGQLFPHDTPIWLNPARDDLRQGRARVVFDADRSHLPVLNGKPVAANEFLSELVKGFTSTYELLLRYREELLKPNGPLAGFEKAFARAVIRPTRDYALLLRELTHPDYEHDSTATDALLENLWRSSCPRYTAAVLQAEIDQLWNGDIPYFEVRGDSRDLFDGDGRVVAEAYLEEATIDGVRRRLNRLSQEDCARQIEIMLRAFSIIDVPLIGIDDSLLAVREGSSARDQSTASSYEAEAAAIADRLLETAIADDSSLTWIGLTMAIDGKWQQTSLDDSLYDGGMGIALFLLYAHLVTGETRYRKAIETMLKGGPLNALGVVARNRNRLADWVTASPSGFELPCSALYLLCHVDALWNTDYLASVWDPAAQWLEVAVERKPRFDLISGAAGVVLQLLTVFEVLKEPVALQLAVRYGEALVNQGRWQQEALSWKNELFAEPLAGITHGSAGCAWALARLAHITGDQRFTHAMRGALQFDRSLVSSTGFWRDPRFGEAEEPYVSWCHGASGLALSRALIYEQTSDEQLVPEIEHAVAIALANVEQSDCLCHGRLGNLDCVQRAASILGRDDWVREVDEKLARTWAESRDSHIWRCGLPNRNVSLPGLFMGLAGIGHGLLRLTHPNVVPSPLALDGPLFSRVMGGA